MSASMIKRRSDEACGQLSEEEIDELLAQEPVNQGLQLPANESEDFRESAELPKTAITYIQTY